MRTEVTELPDSRVRIDVGVESDAVEQAVERAARGLAREMRLPGFRKGKVPPRIVLQRAGRDAVLDQALRDSLPEWYERALVETGVTPVGEPKLDVAALPAAGDDLELSIEIAVRPRAKLGEYRGLEVGRPEVEVPEEAIATELDRLREGFARLTPVERAAAEGDLVVIDYTGRIGEEPFDGGAGRDQLVELGSGSLVEGFEQGLIGVQAGEKREVKVSFPDDYRAEDLAGKGATFAVAVKEVREKELPELNDDFASDASEFDTLDELRGEIRDRIAEALERRGDDEFRTAAVNAAADAAEIELSDEIVAARAEDMLERFLHQLSHQGVDPEAFVGMQESGREGMLAEVRPEAERNLRREATLEAVAEAEAVEVTDEELIEALGPGEGCEDGAKLLARLRSKGRDSLLREEVRMRKAAELIADSAKPIPVERAAAREKLWTPEKGDERGPDAAEPDPAGKPGELWTPGG